MYLLPFFNFTFPYEIIILRHCLIRNKYGKSKTFNIDFE